MNDPVASFLRSPDLRVVRSFTPCESASTVGARVVASVLENPGHCVGLQQIHLRITRAAITRAILTLDRGVVLGSPLRSDLACPRGSRVVSQRAAGGREALTTPRPSVGPGSYVMAPSQAGAILLPSPQSEVSADRKDRRRLIETLGAGCDADRLVEGRRLVIGLDNLRLSGFAYLCVDEKAMDLQNRMAFVVAPWRGNLPNG